MPDFTNVLAIYKGSTEIIKVYRGSTVVWEIPESWFEQNGSNLEIRGAYDATQSGGNLSLS